MTDCALGIHGVYCYHDLITDQTIQLGENLTSIDPSVRPDWYDSISDVSVSMSAIVGMLGTVTLEEGAVLVAAEFFAPVLLVVAPIAFLEALQPYAIEEAESEGNFNTAEYLRDNNLQDQMWDVMFQSVGIGSGPPQGVWDESNHYIQNNPNVQRNLQDIKNMKESARALWNGVIELFLPDQITTLEEVEYAYWASLNLLVLLAEDDDTKLLNEIIELGKVYSDENYDPRLKKDKKAIAQKNVDDYFKKRNPGINLNLGSGDPSQH